MDQHHQNPSPRTFPALTATFLFLCACATAAALPVPAGHPPRPFRGLLSHLLLSNVLKTDEARVSGADHWPSTIDHHHAGDDRSQSLDSGAGSANDEDDDKLSALKQGFLGFNKRYYDYGLGGGRFGKRYYGDYGIGGGRFGRDVDHVDIVDASDATP